VLKLSLKLNVKLGFLTEFFVLSIVTKSHMTLCAFFKINESE